MTNPLTSPVTARLTSPAQMVAALPLHLGYVPEESLVVACLHEPRGRLGLTMRFDLPTAENEQRLADDVVRRVRTQGATRLLLAVYTGADDEGPLYAREALVQRLIAELDELDVTDALLVRDNRYWSYVCRSTRCCPPEGRPVDTAADDSPIRLLEAEQVLRGRAVVASRDALEQGLAGPTFLAAEAAAQRCDEVADELLDGPDHDALLWLWTEAVTRFASPPADLTGEEAARLAMSLFDRVLRDAVAAEHDPDAILPLLAELCRRTPAPYDAPVCTLYAWLTYCNGGGAELTIALERALRTDPSYSMAVLLGEMLDRQVDPVEVRKVTAEAGRLIPAATRRARRSRRSRGSAS